MLLSKLLDSDTEKKKIISIIVFENTTEKCNRDQRKMRWGHIMESSNLENYMTSFATSRQASSQSQLEANLGCSSSLPAPGKYQIILC
jgi:hypothetical protein